MTEKDSILSWVTPVLFLGGLVLIYKVSERLDERFRKRMETLLAPVKLEWFGDNIPAEVPGALLDRLPASLKVIRCVAATLHGERCVSLLYDRGWGRQSRWSTAVAVRRLHAELYPKPRHGKVLGRSGAWVLAGNDSFWRRGWQLSAKEVVEEWASLRTVADDGQVRPELMELDEVMIRPRRRG